MYLTLSYFKIRSSGCCQCPHLHPLDTTISRCSRWFLIPSIYIWSYAGFVHGKSQILGKNIPEKASHQWLLESGIQMSRFPCCSCGIILRCVLDFFSEFSHRIKTLMPISGGALVVHPFSCLPFPVSCSQFPRSVPCTSTCTQIFWGPLKLEEVLPEVFLSVFLRKCSSIRDFKWDHMLARWPRGDHCW